jgi:hypothetical protein
LLELL